MSSSGITRDEAKKLLHEHIKNETFYLHCRESEVIMRALAKHLNENEEAWGTAGLLHDLDWEMQGVQENPEKHGILSTEILEKKGLHSEIIHAIQAHNEEYTGVKRETKLDHALSAAETITGLIFATALVYPDKKLASVKPSSIVKRMKKKDFARNCSRERILECEKIGLSIEQFAQIALKAMQEISDELGL